MNDLGFRYTFTPRYSPEYNGIEEVFSISKNYIKNKRLNAILNQKEMNLENLIYKSF